MEGELERNSVLVTCARDRVKLELKLCNWVGDRAFPRKTVSRRNS